MSRNYWTPEQEEKLLATVDILREKLPKRVRFWSAVAGALAPDILVTADACRCRWERVAKNRAEQAAEAERPTDEDAWRETIAKMEEYEEDNWDRVLSYLAGIRDDINDLRGRLGGIEAEQTRLRKLWE
jgi:hypothetical protein